MPEAWLFGRVAQLEAEFVVAGERPAREAEETELGAREQLELVARRGKEMKSYVVDIA